MRGIFSSICRPDSPLKLAEPQTYSDFKVALLGAGDSGKSTLLKHVKILNNIPLDIDLKAALEDIRMTIFLNLKQLCDCVPEFDESFEEPENRKFPDELNQVDNHQLLDWNKSLAEKMKILWLDPTSQRLLKNRRHEMNIDDAMSFFMSRIDRYVDENYEPDVPDLLHIRKKTLGVINTSAIKVDDMTVNLWDVGGQRTEREKWRKLCNDTALILYMVSISEYNQQLDEVSGVNRMEESLGLFKTTMDASWFADCPVILIFNKCDLLVQRLQDSPLENSFSDYNGANGEESVKKYFKEKFLKLSGRRRIEKVLFTSATDDGETKKAWAEIKKVLMDLYYQV